jgi:hypothetical protein
VTAPCCEKINDHFTMKIYNPAQESRAQTIKCAVAFAVGGLVGLLFGRWLGGHLERRDRDRQRRERYWSDDSAKIKRRHAREWNQDTVYV